MKFKQLILISVIVTGLAACHTHHSHQHNQPVKEGLFIHITESYNQPLRVLMPLKMALTMSGDKEVVVYLDIHAVDFLINGAPDISMDGFESAHTYLDQLAEEKVGVYVCPTCLKIAGFTTEDLKEGIRLADKEALFVFSGSKTISLSY